MKRKHYIRNTAIALCICYLLIFIAFYLQLLIEMPQPVSIIIENLRIFLGYILPPCAAAILISTEKQFKKRLLFALPIAAAKAVFYLPYSYLYYLLGLHYDSLESIVLSLFATLGEISLSYISIILLSLVAMLCAKRKSKILNERDLMLEKDLVSTSLFDTASPINNGILFACLTNLVYIFGITVYNIVIFFITYDNIKLDEYVTMIFDLVLCLAAFIVSFVLSLALKNRIANNKSTDENLIA